jgi:SAM-dependent methyltransferase
MVSQFAAHSGVARSILVTLLRAVPAALTTLPVEQKNMSYKTTNQAKANFDDVYTAPTPHAYMAAMAEHGYEIGERARPYNAAAAALLREQNGGARPVQMLDVGCSYGVGSALIKYGYSFDEIIRFYASAPTGYEAASKATQRWLDTSRTANVRVVGLDSSRAAIRFAVNAGLLDGGIACNFEQPDVAPASEEINFFRSTNLLSSTGALGYITERTLGVVLRHLGEDRPDEFGPYSVMTILRMFEAGSIRRVFEKHGYVFGAVPDVRLAQRRFSDADERNNVRRVLHERGLDTREWEDRGKQYADLFIAAPRGQFERLLKRMKDTRANFEREPVALMTEA